MRIAYDAVLQGSEALGLWVHELGNSLSYITNISPQVAGDAADRYEEVRLMLLQDNHIWGSGGWI